ncbi:MAG: response regulator transcription factor [Tepidisphaeraceae bacterium]
MAEARPTALLLVDDHQLIRQGLKVLLSDRPNLVVVGEASTRAEALEQCQQHRPDVVLMDLMLDDADGADVTRELLQLVDFDCRVIGLSAIADVRRIVTMFHAGARGYVLKAGDFDELATAIETVMGGRMYLSPSIANEVLNALVSSEHRSTSSSSPLTHREMEIVRLVADGHSMKKIAMQLGISVKTVETHRRNVMTKLSIESVADLTKYAIRHGLVDFDLAEARTTP